MSAAFCLAKVSLVLSVASLTWQFATFRLTGTTYGAPGAFNAGMIAAAAQATPSNETLAIIAAVSGLVGVILGGLITGGFQVFLDERTNRRALQRAKRVVAGELLQVQIVLRAEAKTTSWTSYSDVNATLPVGAWEENREYIATIDEDLFSHLVGVYTLITMLRNAFVTAQDASPPLTKKPDHVQMMTTLVPAIDVLRQRLGAKPVTAVFPGL